MNVGPAAVVLLSVCAVPADTDHAYVMVAPSVSVEPVPSKVAVAPSATVASSPASQTGTSSTAANDVVITAEDVPPAASCTV